MIKKGLLKSNHYRGKVSKVQAKMSNQAMEERYTFDAFPLHRNGLVAARNKNSNVTVIAQ